MNREFADIIAVIHNTKLGKLLDRKEVDELRKNNNISIQDQVIEVHNSESKDPFIIREKAINSFRSYMGTLGLKYIEPIDVPYKEVNNDR